jgi:hypothetical protein
VTTKKQRARRTTWRILAGGRSLLGWLSVVCVAFPFLDLNAANVEDPASKRIIERYDILETKWIDLGQWRKRTNDSGTLAWNTSYLMDSYLEVYGTTHQRKYLEKFIALADPLAEQTDEKRGLSDYLGRTRKGWGSVAYSKGRVVWLVHTAMITFPLVKFAMIVGANSDLSDLAARAEKYRFVAEGALAEFDGDWRDDPVTREGYYVFEAGHPLDGAVVNPETPLPINMQLAAGRILIELWELTATPIYRLKAEALARTFKNHLRLSPSGAYSWTYWFGRGLSLSKAQEDMSHGSIDVSFAVIAAQNSIVFTKTDLSLFAKTFFENLSSATARGKPIDIGTESLWAALSNGSCQIYQALYPTLVSHDGSPDPRILLGLSELAKYTKECS